MHWTYDTWALAHGTALALLKAKKDTWFFVTADYAFGHSLEKDALRRGEGRENGKVLGSVQGIRRARRISRRSFCRRRPVRPRSSRSPTP